MRINIVCSDKGWIYDKFIEEFHKHSSHEIVRNDNGDVNHYLPYYELVKKPSTPCTAWMSHREARKDLRVKFDSVAKLVDVPLSHSKKYADLLKEHGAIQIMPGVDFDKFILRYCNWEDRDKLVVGYVGRQYTSSARKNPKLLDAISKLDFVDFRTTGGNMKPKDIPGFYAELDFVVSPATIEGGPMAVTEALAMGVPVICFENVGVANEFIDGVIRVPFNDSQAFLDKLYKMWSTKTYKTWYNRNVGQSLRNQVIRYTWENFVKKHDEVWESLV